MRYCTQCRTELRDDDRYCSRCGTPVDPESQTRASGLFAVAGGRPVGLLVAVGVVGALVLALLLNRHAAPAPMALVATAAPTTVVLPTTTPIPTVTPLPSATPLPTPTATPEPTATPAPTATPRPTATPAPPAYQTNNYSIAPHHFETITVTNASVPSVFEGYFVITPSQDDIGFSVRAPSGSFVRANSRVSGRYEFHYTLDQVGPYIIVFDNSYSLLTGKVITVYWRTYSQAAAVANAAPPAGLEPATYRLEGGSSIP